MDPKNTNLTSSLAAQHLRGQPAELLWHLQEAPFWFHLALCSLATAVFFTVLVALLWWCRRRGASDPGVQTHLGVELETLLPVVVPEGTSPRDDEPSHADGPLPVGPNDEELRQKVAAVGTGFLVRLRWLQGQVQQQLNALQHQFPRCQVALQRALVAADVVSDLNVARLLLAGGNPIWAAVSVSFIALPYSAIWAALTLTGSGTKQLQERVNVAPWMAQALWWLLGPPLLPLVDLAMLTWHWREEPEEPQHYHYLKLRGLFEMAESLPQLFLQTYIAMRLWNPMGCWPEVAGYQVPPSSLMCGICSSLLSLWLQWDFLHKFGNLQGQGSWTAFLWSMASLGEGLAPSHIFTDLQTREKVDVDLDLNRISRCEMMSIARTVKTSKALQEVTFKRPLRVWVDDNPNREYDDIAAVRMSSFIETLLCSAKLRVFAITFAAPLPQGFMDTVWQLARADHPSLESFSVNEEKKVWNKPRLRLCDVSPDKCQNFKLTRSLFLMAVRQDNLEVLREMLLRCPGLASERVTPLLEAASFGAVRATELLLAAGADPCRPSSNGQFPVLMASDKGHVECLRLLLQRGGAATVNSVDEQSGHFPVLAAARNGHAECLRLLLRQEGAARVNGVNEKTGTFPVLMASQNGHTECLRLLLQRGGAATANAASTDDKFPVLMAAQLDHPECLRLLLEHGGAASVNKPNTKNGNFPVLMTAFNGSAACLQLLLQHGGQASVNKVHEERGVFPLLIAAQTGRLECMLILLQHGASASVNTVNQKTGTFPVLLASQNGHVACLQLLLDHGAQMSVNVVNEKNGNFPVLVSANNGHTECLRLLLQCGGAVSVSTVNTINGVFPVLMASASGHTACLELLLQHGGGASVNAANEHDDSFPVLLASETGHAECLRLLLQHGGAASVNTVCEKRGTFPVLAAAQNGHADCLLLLLQHGGAASVNTVCEKSGDFPVLSASRNGHAPCLRMLLENGGAESLSCAGRDHLSPAEVAAEHGHQDCVRLIEATERRRPLDGGESGPLPK